MQPRYGFTVHSNGMREAPGTRFTIERARISWKVIPLNSGVSKVRVVTASAAKSAPLPSFVVFSARLSQRMNASSVALRRE